MSLSVVRYESDHFAVMYGDVLLHTSMGGHHPVVHRNVRLLENLVGDLRARGDITVVDGEVTGPMGFDSYSLFCLQKDWVEPGKDNLTTDFLLEMIHEPMLEACADPGTWHILPFKDSVNAWLNGMGVKLVDLDYVDHERLDGVPEDHFRSNGNMGDDDHVAFEALSSALSALYSSFSDEQKSVSTYLTNITGHFMIYSLRLAAGACSPEEYGMALAAVQMYDPDEESWEAEGRRAADLVRPAVRFLELSSTRL